MESSKIFDLTYNTYLSQIKELDISRRAVRLGIEKQCQSFVFDFFNRKIVFDGNGFTDMTGQELTFAVKVVLCKYILMCPEQINQDSHTLVSFREFENSGPLLSNFTANTNKIIETTFSGQLEKLKIQCVKLGGTFLKTQSYDLSVRFQALPMIPIILNFNDKDELLPAKAGLLYHDTAEIYLDPECLCITGTCLTGLLITD